MKLILSALLSGIIFGFGLALAGMTNPAIVLAFLDFFGDWNATLALVMGGAVAVTLPAFYFVQKRGKPIFEEKFFLPTSQIIDKRLIIGAALFGLGWGIAGLCPGPAITSLATLNMSSVYFVIAMFVGFIVSDKLISK